ncbi:MAG: twin-arginine translocase TatA/TatE family subunit [Gemmatimonadetes bacterium]|nr:twin-arginine translocase TatA/TatE family subunit [Gemmatimonadota bacterium]
MFGMGVQEMMLLLLVVLLLFGAKRIPEIAGSFGKGIKEFKKNMNDVQREIQTPDAPRTEALPRGESANVRDESVPAVEPKRLI